MTALRISHAPRFATLIAALAALTAFLAAPVAAQVTAFKQAVAEAAAKDEAISDFYQSNGYEPVWTGDNATDRARRNALLEAVSTAATHGLPSRRYDPNAIRNRMAAARTPRELGILDVELSRVFLQYARDIQSGVLEPSRVDSGIKREAPTRDGTSHLARFVDSSPRAFLRSLPPRTNEYARLMKEKMHLERLLGEGGWGQQVQASKLEPGDSGEAVVALRNRLNAMGYLGRSATQTYDAPIQKAVQWFQTDHGLATDGVAGPDTMTEINRPVEARLQSVIVAMERERWMNIDRGARHVEVNLTDFSARIIDNDMVTFETRSVVGADTSDRRSPEFSDVMEHMVVNPTWNVPRSITVKEYLPQLQRNRHAVGHLRVIDKHGRVVPRGAVNFAAYNARTFPFDLKQPPSNSNALGLVKFMFPNRYNIYLHDTPSKSLFDKNVRAFSHGCIRLQQPFEFAYALLARQTNDPEGLFRSRLNTGAESVIRLEQPIPVHIMYRTAFTRAKGNTQYRRDVYGRDGRIWSALANAGVALRAPQS